MRINIKKYVVGLGLIASVGVLNSCNKFLDRSPLDEVTPEDYLKTEADLAAYTIKAYDFTSHSGYGVGTFANDFHTDNAITSGGSTSLWVPGNRRVENTSDSYSFSAIRNANFFLKTVLENKEAGVIAGSTANIDHYIGEMYVLRAWKYFDMLKRYGDFPIVTELLVDNKELLISQSKRAPRNKVARFILEDIDRSLSLLQGSFKNKNRISRDVALLIKSRVALYEASWLTYHKGTAFVPGNAQWPGAKADYNADFSIDLDAEIKFFLDQAASASKEIADKVVLTANSGLVNPNAGEHSKWNPYFEMFSAEDMGVYPEVLLWRDYDRDLNIQHHTSKYIMAGAGCGVLRGAIDTYLMSNGLPIYAAASGYGGDDDFNNIKTDRDGRLQLFVFGYGDTYRILNPTEPFDIPFVAKADLESRDLTGYRNRKYLNYNPLHAESGSSGSDAGSIIFRGVEAYLNYIEAVYMRDGALDGTATAYWKAIRKRAMIDEDFNATIAATNLTKESDWATYSGGVLVDATLYNIRRERRLELLGESIRMDDLKRWRALDQVKNYIPEGVNLWTSLHTRYKAGELVETGKDKNVSSKTDSKYLRPYRVVEVNNELYNGYNWSKANYLSPLPAYEIRLSATLPTDGGVTDLGTSPLYQNPYWPLLAGQPATE